MSHTVRLDDPGVVWSNLSRDPGDVTEAFAPEVEDGNDILGTCDNCDARYEVSSRDGRCGDCGDCGDCCEHVFAAFPDGGW